MWFCIPFTLSTGLGLATVACDLPVSVDEANMVQHPTGAPLPPELLNVPDCYIYHVYERWQHGTVLHWSSLAARGADRDWYNHECNSGVRRVEVPGHDVCPWAICVDVTLYVWRCSPAVGTNIPEYGRVWSESEDMHADHHYCMEFGLMAMILKRVCS